MPNFCQVTIIGHAGKDPQMSDAGEHKVARFSVATSRKRKPKDATTWWEVTAWNKTASIAAEYVRKGDAVMVVGEAWQEEWTDRDGNKRLSLKVEAQRLVLLGGKKREAPPVDGEDVPSAPPAPSKAAPLDDEPPF